MKKNRTQIPANTAAKVQFDSDRTCCVCRTRGKQTQIHHLDGDPSNHDRKNLALLCLDCHNETMIQGGVGRKLNAELVIRYRDSWHRLVATKRAQSAPDPDAANRRRAFRGLLRGHLQKFEALGFEQLRRGEAFLMQQASIPAIAEECAKILDDIPKGLQTEFNAARREYCGLKREEVEPIDIVPPWCEPSRPIRNFGRGRQRVVELMKRIIGYAE